MFKALSPRTIGLREIALPAAVELAAAAGFDGLYVSSREVAELADQRGIAHVRDLFARSGMRPGGADLPVDWRDDARWADDLRELPRVAGLVRDLGTDRITTFMPSGSDERDYEANFAWHVERFRPIATVLRDAGCRLGIEFIGTRSYRAQFRHPFIYTLDGLMDLAAAIGTGNVGLLLDAWHVYASGRTMADLDRIGERDVVLVHVNDAPAGIAVDDQIDTVRTLPMETGAIDLIGFMERLRRMGYDGPVVAEPFSARVNQRAQTDALGAARETAASLDALWRAVGLG